MGRHNPGEVNAAPLPGRRQHLGGGGLDTLAGIDPQIRPVPLDRAFEEGFHPLVDLLAEPADLARYAPLEIPLMPSALTRSSTERVEMP